MGPRGWLEEEEHQQQLRDVLGLLPAPSKAGLQVPVLPDDDGRMLFLQGQPQAVGAVACLGPLLPAGTDPFVPGSWVASLHSPNPTAGCNAQSPGAGAIPFLSSVFTQRCWVGASCCGAAAGNAHTAPLSPAHTAPSVLLPEPCSAPSTNTAPVWVAVGMFPWPWCALHGFGAGRSTAGHTRWPCSAPRCLTYDLGHLLAAQGDAWQLHADAAEAPTQAPRRLLGCHRVLICSAGKHNDPIRAMVTTGPSIVEPCIELEAQGC